MAGAVTATATAAAMTAWETALLVTSIVLMVASLAISLFQMMTYKAPQPPVPNPQAISFIPTADQGKEIPVVFGTRVVTQPNVVWWDHAHSTPNKMNPNALR